MKKEYLIFTGILIAFVIYSYVLYQFGIQHQKIVYLKSIPQDSTITYHFVKPVESKPVKVNSKESLLPYFDTPLLFCQKDTTKWWLPTENSYSSEIDTVLGRDTLNVKYITNIPVKGIFEITLKHHLEKVIMDTIDIPFYKTFTFGYIAGIMTVILILLLKFL